MIDFTKIVLEDVYVHQVGNKLRDEGIKISKKETSIADEETKNYLLEYFLSPFKNNEVYNFCHSSELNFNEIYIFIKRLFSNPNIIYELSIEISKHLYEKSTHPKINGGEFCICYFKNCLYNGIPTAAIGFFKSEKKDTFLKFDPIKDSFMIKHDNGININKLDKGCLIFNLDETKGYNVCIIDSNKSNDTQYWKNDFLNIKPASDNYHFTKDFLSITKDYVTKKIHEDFDVSKADQIDILNRSVDYFKKHEMFDKKEFEEEVFSDSNVIESFQKFDHLYRQEKEIELSDNFEISTQAVKKQARVFKSILKLDKNFHIYIHGNKNLIEKGFDEASGMNFYKVYFKVEN